MKVFLPPFPFPLPPVGLVSLGSFMHSFYLKKEITSAFEIYSYLPRQRRQNVGHYNCLINFKQPSET
jgi:hypothetical protein